MTDQNKCYSCKRAVSVPNSAHTECMHPGRYREVPHFMAKIAGGSARTDAPAPLNIEASAESIKAGWFAWPINFDPVWLVRCDGYQERGK